MPNRKLAMLTVSHLATALLGFMLGIYILPILIAPAAPSAQKITELSATAQFSGTFKKDLLGSDTFHWGQGTVSITQTAITLQGSLAPGPDYKLYLSPHFVETEADFNRLKASMVRVGDIKTFENFAIPLPAHITPSNYTSVVVWCETFGEFITAAQYQ